MNFDAYTHLVRYGTDAADGINIGECHIFPKLDGTNSSIWRKDDGTMGCGSRSRDLNVHEDNAGFMNWALGQKNLHEFLEDHQGLRLHGEWLVPHSLKTYQDDAWRKFYVFDVMNQDGKYLHYDEYMPVLKSYGIDFIPCILKSNNPSYEILLKATENNKFLIKDNSGVGEGIVIKQYGWRNRFDHPAFAKLITNTFKDKHIQEMGGAVVNQKLVEEAIADEFVTEHLVEKTVAKIRNEGGQFGARNIPQLLGMVFHDLVSEEMWQAIKKHKNPKVCFKTLNHCTVARIKQLKPELFGMAPATV